MSTRFRFFYALLVLCLVAGTRLEGANIVITIDLDTGGVTASGSYTLFDAATTVPETRPLITTAGGGWSELTNAAAGSSLSPILDNAIGVSLDFPLGSINWNITDTSNSDAIIVSNDVNQISFGANSAFIGFDGVAVVNFPASVDAGDIFNINGNFTLPGSEIPELAVFSPGSHVSTYNGQSLTLTFVPEPSSVVLVLLGVGGTMMRRRR